jgi:rhodanese-related sulfurtransferase
MDQNVPKYQYQSQAEDKENIANQLHQQGGMRPKKPRTFITPISTAASASPAAPALTLTSISTSTMSPVSSLSYTLSSMAVVPEHQQLQLQPQQPTTTYSPLHQYNSKILLSPTYVLPQLQRVAVSSSVRRRLSLSTEPTPSPSFHHDGNIDTMMSDRSSPPKKKSASFGEESHPARVSPYKTPKRGLSGVGDVYDDLSTSLTRVADLKNEANSYSLRASFDFSLKKRLYRSDSSIVDTSCTTVAPLRRSSSALQFKKNLPKPDMIPCSPTPLSPRPCPPCADNDGSKAYLLPTIIGAHPDLNCISPDTVVALMKGEYRHIFQEYFIIDCRFPYEYEGGHIKGALNLTEDEVHERFIKSPITDRKVCIIFHCEFSSKRAPQSYRALRESDRKANFVDYPKLYYPEIYYIHGGYKQFYETYESYCNGTYVEMRDENHSVQYKQFNKIRRLTRSKSLDCFAAQLTLSQIQSYQPSKLKPQSEPDRN